MIAHSDVLTLFKCLGLNILVDAQLVEAKTEQHYDADDSKGQHDRAVLWTLMLHESGAWIVQQWQVEYTKSNSKGNHSSVPDLDQVRYCVAACDDGDQDELHATGTLLKPSARR